MYRIGDFSKLAKTTVKTLRYYDEIGILNPQSIDPFTGYRLYTTAQLFVLHRIQSLRQIGLSIDHVRMILDGQDATSILAARKSQLLKELSLGQNQLSCIEFILSGQEEASFMNYQALTKTLPACTVYSKEMTIPSYDAYFQVIPAIGEQVTKKYPTLKCAVPEYCFVIYLDGEYKEKDIHVQFCEAVTEKKPDFEDIRFLEMPAVPAICVMHKGAYRNLGKAYAFLFKWIEENGYISAASPRECYIDGIWNKENEEDWLTELQLPIQPK